MDYAVPPHIDAAVKAFSDALSGVESVVVRQLIVNEAIQRCGMKAITISLPLPLLREFDAQKLPVLFRAVEQIAHMIDAGNVASLSIEADPHGERWFGTEAPPERPKRERESVVISPHGGSYAVRTCGPVEVRLPHWIPHALAVDIGGLLWRVLRFCVSGHRLPDRMRAAAAETMREVGMEHLVDQLSAVGQLRWLLSEAGIPVYDIYGREWQEDPALDYRVLFEENPEWISPELRAMVREFRKG